MVAYPKSTPYSGRGLTPLFAAFLLVAGTGSRPKLGREPFARIGSRSSFWREVRWELVRRSSLFSPLPGQGGSVADKYLRQGNELFELAVHTDQRRRELPTQCAKDFMRLAAELMRQLDR